MDLAYLAELPLEEFITRRKKVFAQMQDNSAFVIFTETEKRRNNDFNYHFRPDSYFWYLTGFAEPESALLLIKRNGEYESIIFLRKKDREKEIWTGRRLGVEAAPEILKVDAAFEIEHLAKIFAEKTQNLTACYYAQGYQAWGDKVVSAQFKEVIDWRPMLSEMRLIKSTAEIALIQQACHISALAHIRAMKQTRPNRYENSAVMKDGDLLLIDAGAEFAYYAGDITRTFPVNGKFSEPQKAIYELVLKAQKEAIKLLVPSNSIKMANDRVIEIFTEGLVALGILKGDVHTLIEQKAYRQFYMHGLGHWLGLDVHDVGDYSNERSRPLEIGMVITVEPGLYIASDADVPEQYKGIGIRIEDNLLMTEYGNKNLTSGCPKEIADIEEIMATA